MLSLPRTVLPRACKGTLAPTVCAIPFVKTFCTSPATGPSVLVTNALLTGPYLTALFALTPWSAASPKPPQRAIADM